ncbi:conserved hypothetical protein [Ricinus communis]|uniref:Retrotransposon gag domain-containing protein n=1 Tax=Ricinus communis TaxID=3988 RepID=B9T2Y8_RICCO|nr:conserved hypothetical protein [Ricinus communis]
MFESRPAKLEFPKFQGDDPTVWHTRVEQYFDFQMTTESKKVPLASYHFEGEANEWWQWLNRAYKNEGKVVTWEALVEELWARQFEQLGNRVHGWTQKALVGTFMGGLKLEIADAIRFFKPKTLKDAIEYARMKDQQLQKQ